jgi:hypothetical protein
MPWQGLGKGKSLFLLFLLFSFLSCSSGQAGRDDIRQFYNRCFLPRLEECVRSAVSRHCNAAAGEAGGGRAGEERGGGGAEGKRAAGGVEAGGRDEEMRDAGEAEPVPSLVQPARTGERGAG